MVFRMFGTKQLSEPMIIYYQSDHREQIPVFIHKFFWIVACYMSATLTRPDLCNIRLQEQYISFFFVFFRQALELKEQYTQSARCGSEINFHVITKPEINRTREMSSCITDSSLNPTSAATRTKYMKLCLVHVSHEIGHVMMTPLQSPTPLVLLLACFTKIFQQSGSNANDRLVTIHMHLNQWDFESYKERKTTKGIGTWNQSWYVACQNRHVLHTNFTSKTYHQNPGIRVLFIRITNFFVIKVIRPNNADSKSSSWYFRQKKMIISLQ